MTLDEQIEILQAAKRGEKIEWAYITLKEPRGWYEMLCGSDKRFNFQAYDYRIVDPYAELKAAARDPTKQIRCHKGDWVTGDEKLWRIKWEFNRPINNYEIRDKPNEKRKVKYLCYAAVGFGEQLFWYPSTTKTHEYLKRRPAFDKECEVEDE
jgi:hypothetical protein